MSQVVTESVWEQEEAELGEGMWESVQELEGVRADCRRVVFDSVWLWEPRLPRSPRSLRDHNLRTLPWIWLFLFSGSISPVSRYGSAPIRLEVFVASSLVASLSELESDASNLLK